MPGGRPRQRPLLALSGAELTPGASRRLCTLERAPTPGGSQRSPVTFKLDVTPAHESGSARKRRLDRNRQAELHAAAKAARGEPAAAKPTRLDFERRIADSIDRAQPELGFDMAALGDNILMAQRSRRPDQHEAALAFSDADADVERRVGAAVHLMVGRDKWHMWTPTGKLRAVCDRCNRAYATTLDGSVRKHKCV